MIESSTRQGYCCCRWRPIEKVMLRTTTTKKTVTHFFPLFIYLSDPTAVQLGISLFSPCSPTSLGVLLTTTIPPPLGVQLCFLSPQFGRFLLLFSFSDRRRLISFFYIPSKAPPSFFKKINACWISPCAACLSFLLSSYPSFFAPIKLFLLRYCPLGGMMNGSTL